VNSVWGLGSDAHQIWDGTSDFLVVEGQQVPLKTELDSDMVKGGEYERTLIAVEI
jgi:hypothetical protein